MSRRAALAALACIVAVGSLADAAVDSPLAADMAEAKSQAASGGPILLPLRRQAMPLKHNGEVISYRHTLFGKIEVGQPRREFSVVFDTGSGHVVLPSSTCASEACLNHRRYDVNTSASGYPVNADSQPPVEQRDEVAIRFGTGSLTGEFVRDQVCIGGDRGLAHAGHGDGMCVDMNIVVATEMSSEPFKSMTFDGIFGLGLDSLALTPDFSFFSRLYGGSGGMHQFGIYLASGDGEEGSELAIGGHNEARLQGPLSWAPVVAPQLGQWLVEIKSVRIGTQLLDICKSAPCRGIVDTGSSHLGVPKAHMLKLFKSLSSPSGDVSDCRKLSMPPVHLELENFTVTLTGEDYMRQIPTKDVGRTSGGKTCRPRLMPVNMPEQFGKDLFILGEPVLLRYYTVFNWQDRRVGFSLAAPRSPGLELEKEDEEKPVFLMQVSLRLVRC